MSNELTTRSSASVRTVCFGAFEFDPQTGELRKHGLRIKLQGQPLKALTMLLQQPGEVVTRDELQKRLWPAETYVDFEHSLNAAEGLQAAWALRGRAALYRDSPAHAYRFLPQSQPVEDVPPATASRPRAEGRAGSFDGAVLAVIVLLAVGMNLQGYATR
jgi:hypothetical protein